MLASVLQFERHFDTDANGISMCHFAASCTYSLRCRITSNGMTNIQQPPQYTAFTVSQEAKIAAERLH